MIKIIIFAVVLGMLLGFGVWKLTPVPKIEIPVQQKFAYNFSKPPTDSIVGKIASVSGDVYYKKRIGEEIVLLDKNTIFQGENLIASDSGKITVDFEGNTIHLEPKTEVDIIQTLPGKLVFNQISGSVSYNIIGSVRAKRLLVEITKSTTIVINKNKTEITGLGKIAYNDANFNSKVLDLVEGKTTVFDDTLRAVVK